MSKLTYTYTFRKVGYKRTYKRTNDHKLAQVIWYELKPLGYVMYREHANV